VGRSYLIEYCVRFHKQKVDAINYRVNLTETNRGLLGYWTGKWEDIPRYLDSLLPPKHEKELTSDEIINKIKNKIKQSGG